MVNFMKETATMSTQQIAGYKAAYTRKVNGIIARVQSGELTKARAAGFKAAAKRRLNKQLETA